MKNRRVVSTILVLIMIMFILNLRNSKAYSKYAPIEPSYTFGVGESNSKFKMVKVTILVRDVDGTPIEGAQVKAFSEEWGLFYPDWFGYTNSSGMFTFEIPAGNWSFFAGGGWGYAWTHPGEACFMALVNVMVENNSTLILQPDDEFNVTVYDLNGQPIDVSVRLMESSHTPIVVAPDCGRASEGHLRIHVNSGLKYDVLLYLDGNGVSYVFFKRNIVPSTNMIISASSEDLARLRFELHDTDFNLMPGLYVHINYHEFSVGETTGLQPVTFYIEGAEDIYVTPSLVGIWYDVNVEGWHYHFPPSDYSLVNGEYRVFRVGGKFTVRVHVLREDTQIWLDVRDSFGNVLINYCHNGEARIPITLTRNGEVIFEGDIAEIVGWWNALVAGKLDRTYSLEDSPHYHITLDLGPFGRFELEGVLLSPETMLQYRKIESEHFIINVPNVSSPLLYEKFNKIAEFFEIAYEAERNFIGEWIEGKTNITFYINYISAGFAGRNTIGMGIGFSIDSSYATVPSTFISVALHELGHVFQLSPPLRNYFIESWFGEPFATLIGHGGLRRIFGRLLELREQGGHNRHFFEYLAGREELNLGENIQFVLFYLNRKYGEEIHRRFVQLWGNETWNKARMTLEEANFNRSEIIVILYSYIAKENLAWLFKSAGLKVSESRVEEGLRLIGLLLDLSDFPAPLVVDGLLNVTFVVGETKPHGLYSMGARTVDVVGAIGLAISLGLSADEGSWDQLIDIDIASGTYVDWSSIGARVVVSVGGPIVNMFTHYYFPANETGHGNCPFYLNWIVGRYASIKSLLTGREYVGVGRVRDYAVIALYYEEGEDKWVLVVWGLTGNGSQAACHILAHYNEYRELLVGRAVIIEWIDANDNDRVDDNDTYRLVEMWEG